MAVAQDAVKVAPHVYKVLFENARIRLLEVRLKVGDKSSMHGHPAYLVYSLGASKVKFTSGSGETAELDLQAGQAMWREPEEHAANNLGKTDVHALLFELK